MTAMEQDLNAVPPALAFRQRARHAEAQAKLAASEVQRQALLAVAEMWREIALDTARARRRGRTRRGNA